MSSRGIYHFGTAAVIVVAVEVLTWAIMLGAWWLLDREVPSFRFERPEMLRGMLGGPLLVLLFIIDLAWRNRALGRFAHITTLQRMVPGVSTTRTVLRFLLLRQGLGFAVLALAAPQLGSHQEVVKAKGIDLVVAVDVSNSMACEDLKPSRMLATRRALEQLIDRSKGDRLGIVVFAGDAFVQLPITTDRAAAKLFLSTVGPGSVGTQGTAIGAAIDLARQSFDPESHSGKAIIVITDGENHEDDAIGAAQRAATDGIVVHTVGMGTPEGGPLPVKVNGRMQGFRKDADGTTVVSRLNEAMLRRIATEGNGAYVRATSTSTGILELVDQLKTMDRAETGSTVYTAHEDQFQYPLGVAILLCLCSLLLGEQRNPRTAWRAISA